MVEVRFFDYAAASRTRSMITRNDQRAICRMLSEGMPLADICGAWGESVGLGCSLGDVVFSMSHNPHIKARIETAQALYEQAKACHLEAATMSAAADSGATNRERLAAIQEAKLGIVAHEPSGAAHGSCGGLAGALKAVR